MYYGLKGTVEFDTSYQECGVTVHISSPSPPPLPPPLSVRRAYNRRHISSRVTVLCARKSQTDRRTVQMGRRMWWRPVLRRYKKKRKEEGGGGEREENGVGKKKDRRSEEEQKNRE